MTDLTSANSLYTFICEKDSTSGYNARNYDKGAVQVNHYTTAEEMFKEVNDWYWVEGESMRVGIRNGLYEVGDTEIDSNERLVNWGHSDVDESTVVIEGETREGVIIRNTRTPVESEEDLFAVNGSVEIRNLTLDGNALGVKETNEMNLFRAQNLTDGKRIMIADNCAFLRHTGSGFRCGSNENFLGAIAQNCFFSRMECAGDDQCSNHANGWGKSVGNYLTNINAAGDAGYDGSALTGGTSRNIIVSGNTVERLDDLDQGISLEPFSGNTAYALITGNIVHNGNVKIGQDTYAGTAKYLEISNNIVFGGELRLKGPTDGLGHSTQMKYGVIKNNLLVDPVQWGIYVNNTAGFCEVRGNTVINSNSSLTNSTSNACIRLNACSQIIVEDNTCYMGVTSPEDANFSKTGIRYFDITNSKIQNNRFINVTLAPNPEYSGGGTNTGSIISKNK